MEYFAGLDVSMEESMSSGAIIGGMPTPNDDSGCGAAYRTGLRCRDR
jgi:hypothetical protein